MNRRLMLLAGVAALVARPSFSQSQPLIKVMKTPTCGCCSDWVDHVMQSGFAVDAKDVEQIALYAEKDRLQIAPELSGCHTAMVEGYFIEGHVPASDIQRLLAERPSARGLTVPGMPMSSYGMAGPGAGDTYDTLLVTMDGSTSVYASHS